MAAECKTIQRGGATIGFEQRGEGPALVLIHAGVFYVQSWLLNDRLACAITQPVLILAGGASPPPVWDTARRITESLPNATLEEVAEADHLWALRDPGSLAERVRRFAQEVAVR